MKSNTDHEKIFLQYYLKNPKYLKKLKSGFFKIRDIDYIAILAQKFFLKFNEIPSIEQLKVVNKDEESSIDEDIIDSIFSVNLKEIDPDWIKRTAESWMKWRHFNDHLLNTIEYVKTQNVTPDNVEVVVQRAIGMMGDQANLVFDSDIGLDFFNPEDHNQRVNDKVSTGWNFIDNATGGGYDKGSLVVYAGETNIGKSIWLANDAANFVQMGHNVVFISAEMSKYKVVKRIGSNLLNIHMDEYTEKAKNPSFIKRKLEKLTRSNMGLMPIGRLFVTQMPTSQATVLDVESYVRSVEEQTGVNIDVVVIDYINILSNYRNPNTENTYLKIKQIAEDLRGFAVKRNKLVISATQLNRSGFDSTDVRMDNVAESAGLLHTVDFLFGIIQDTAMNLARIYHLKILKIRDGSAKGLRSEFAIDYGHMRITENGPVGNGH